MMIKNFVGIKTFYGMNTIELGGGGSPAPRHSPNSEIV